MNTLFPSLRWLLVILAVAVTGCATQKTPTDYSAFKESRPRSILVLPPLNNTPEVRASDSMLAQVTQPLAESGYRTPPLAPASTSPPMPTPCPSKSCVKFLAPMQACTSP